MTDRDTTPPSPRRRTRKPSPLPVFAGALAAFVATFGFLGVRMAQGQDPALGAPKAQVASVAKHHRSRARKHHRSRARKHVTPKHVTVQSSAPAAAPAPAPVQSSAPAPTPAPAPAPVQSSTS